MANKAVAVEMHYTVDQVALLVQLHPKTVIEKMKAGAFGVYRDLADPNKEAKKQSHDYRIPASGINAYLDCHTPPQLGICARNEGELRRKASLMLTDE